MIAAVDGFKEHFTTGFGEMFICDAYSGEGRIDEIIKNNIINTDDRNITGNGESGAADAADCTDGIDICSAENSCGHTSGIENQLHLLFGRFIIQLTGTGLNPGERRFQAVILHGAAVSFKGFVAETGLGKAAANIGNVFVSKRNQVFNGKARCIIIIHAKAEGVFYNSMAVENKER